MNEATKKALAEMERLWAEAAKRHQEELARAEWEKQ